MTANTTIMRLAAAALLDPPTNPNSMPVERFELLKEAMLGVGYAQPVLVRPVPAGHELVDGVHRARGVRELLQLVPQAEPDLERRRRIVKFQATHADGAIECVVRTMTDEQARAVQIGMNRLRGELDLARVANTMADLATAGWAVEDMQITGFTADEVDSLLATTATFGDDAMPGAFGGLEEQEEEKAPKPFVLELTFATRDELKMVKKKLSKAAGGGRSPDLSIGLIRLVNGS